MVIIISLILILIGLLFYLFFNKKTKQLNTVIHIELYNDDELSFLAEPVHITSGVDIHDTTVQSSTRLALVKLKEWYTTQDKNISDAKKEDSLDQIKTLLFQSSPLPWRTKELAYSTIQTIINVQGTLSEIDLTEYDVLHLIWQRIQAPLNSAEREALTTAFIEGLAEGSASPDEPHCLTGRVSQMVQSLQTLDHEGIVNIVTLNLFKEELGTKFPFLIRSYFQQTEGKESLGLESLESPEVKKKVIHFIDSNLRKDFHSLSEKDYTTITKDYFDALV
jgi:hypothetical protein